MALYTWVTTACPFYAERGSYREKRESNMREFKPEVGPPKREPRSYVPTYLVSFRMKLTSAQLLALDSIFMNTLNQGVYPFWADHPRTGAVTKFAFAEEYTVSDIGYGWFEVEMNMRQLP